MHTAAFLPSRLNAWVTPTVTVEMTKGVDYTGYTDALGNKINWRYCIAPPTNVHPQLNGQMAFDPQSVPHCTGADSVDWHYAAITQCPNAVFV